MAFDELVVSFFVDEVVGGFFINVPPGHVACLYDRGRGVLHKVWGPGLHVKIPFWQIAKLFNAQILEYTITEGFDLSQKESLGDKAINATTQDNKLLQIEGSILFKINKAKVPDIWENIGENFISKVIRPVSRSRIRAVISEVTANQFTAYRTEVEKKVKEELNNIFNDKGINCEGFLLSEVKLLDDSSTLRDDKVLLKEENPR
ncbi:MAG TPA: prohibitin family protein [Candidatus Bathyarchaeia archaeon]|nr:prohibitin family protein [Candidatus Bathyarchaeia archaeon]